MNLVSFIPGIGPTALFTPGANTPAPFNVAHTGVTDGTSPATASNNMAELYNRILLAQASVIVKAGLTPDTDNWTQLAEAIAYMASSAAVAVSTGGTANAITATFSPPVMAVSDGSLLMVKAAYANTSDTVTFTPNSGPIAPVPVRKNSNNYLSVDDIHVDRWMVLQYNATWGVYVLLNPAVLHNQGTSSVVTNEAFGSGSLQSTTTGGQNSAFGFDTLLANTTGGLNTAIGAGALQSNDTGESNTAVGAEALLLNVIGIRNVAVGARALRNNTASNNIAVGFEAARDTFGGTDNVAIGVMALQTNTSGSGNIAIGKSTLLNSGLGAQNIAIGIQSMTACTSGASNVGIGADTLSSNTTGVGNSALGTFALSAGSALDNATGVGYNAQVTGNDQVQLGNASTTTYVYGTVQNRSDIRDKADVRDTTLGLSFVMSLRPVDYRWDLRADYQPMPPKKPSLERPDEASPTYAQDLAAYEAEQDVYRLAISQYHDACKPGNLTHDGSKKRTRFHHGFIAQDVVALGADFGGVQDHKVNGGEDVLSLGYDEFIAPLVRAVQEQQATIEALRSELDLIKTRLTSAGL